MFVTYIDHFSLLMCYFRYHVEYLQTLLALAEIPATAIYSQLDPAARKINTAKFASKKVNVMIVTDLAARGIDIPLLDNVINYHFPAKSKLFVHRVGRVARAGRQGTAFSLVSPDEVAYYVDLQLFLGGESPVIPVHYQGDDWHRRLGSVPQSVLDEFSDTLVDWFKDKVDLIHNRDQSRNAYKQYLKSRPGASKESVKRSKHYKDLKIGTHPVLKTDDSDEAVDEVKTNFLEQLKSFKPRSTIFEIGNTSKNKEKIDVMNEKRRKHSNVIEQNMIKLEQSNKENEANLAEEPAVTSTDQVTEEDITNTFETIVKESKNRTEKKLKNGERQPKKAKPSKDENNYIPYQPLDHHSESGYSLHTGFSAQAHGAVLDLTGDDDAENRRRKGAMVWDKKSKKYVKVQDDKKRIKTESGVYISATYKTNRYNKWKERSKLAQQEERDNDDQDDGGDTGHTGARGNKRPNTQLSASHPAMKKAKMAVKIGRKNKNEIRRPEQILKQRVADEKRAARKAKGGGKKKRR